MKIINECLDRYIKKEVDKAINNFCNNIDKYDFYDLYKYIIKKYQLYLFYDPYKDEYYVSEDPFLLE